MAVSNEELRKQQEASDGQKIGQTIQEVSERAQLLVREEVELAKAELSEKVSTLARGAAIGAAAGFFVAIALLLLLHGLAWLVWYLLFEPTQNYFWGFFIMTGLLLLLGALAGFIAYRAVKKGTPPTPELAIDEAKRIRETVSSKHPERTI